MILWLFIYMDMIIYLFVILPTIVYMRDPTMVLYEILQFSFAHSQIPYKKI